jgi:hypothetical protein
MGQAAWRLGISVREYREIEAGERGRTGRRSTGSASCSAGPRRSLVAARKGARMADGTLEIVGADPSEKDGMRYWRVTWNDRGGGDGHVSLYSDAT